MPRTNAPIGSSFDAFLRDEGLLADTLAVAVKAAVVDQINGLRTQKRITRNALAKRAGLTRPQLDRALDPDHIATSLQTIARVAAALDVGVTVQLS